MSIRIFLKKKLSYICSERRYESSHFFLYLIELKHKNSKTLINLTMKRSEHKKCIIQIFRRTWQLGRFKCGLHVTISGSNNTRQLNTVLVIMERKPINVHRSKCSLVGTERVRDFLPTLMTSGISRREVKATGEIARNRSDAMCRFVRL